MEEYRQKNRVSSGLPNQMRIDIPRIYFSKCTKKQALEASFLNAKRSLHEISLGDLSKIEYLGSEHHMKFLESSKLSNEFFSIFPFDFFMNQILLDDPYSLPSLKICTKCITNKYCPSEFLSLISNDLDLAKYLCTIVLPKNDIDSSISCFQLFSAMALSSPDIKEYLLDSDIIFEKINQFSDNTIINQCYKRFFLITASNFIFNCLTSSPISDEQKINNISQVYYVFLSNEDELVVAHAIKLLKKLRKTIEIGNLYDDIQEKSLEYIKENYLNTQSTEIGLAVYSLLQEIESIEYLNLTLNFLQNSGSQKIIKKCLKTMTKRYQEWSSVNNDEVCQILINFAHNSSFVLQKQATKVLTLYWDQSKMISGDYFILLTNFLNEKNFGIVCMNIILACLNSSFSQDVIKNFVDEFWNPDLESQICDIMANGDDEESATADLLLEAFRSFCS